MREYYVEYLVNGTLVQTRCDLLTIKELEELNAKVIRYFWS